MSGQDEYYAGPAKRYLFGPFAARKGKKLAAYGDMVKNTASRSLIGAGIGGAAGAAIGVGSAIATRGKSLRSVMARRAGLGGAIGAYSGANIGSMAGAMNHLYGKNSEKYYGKRKSVEMNNPYLETKLTELENHLSAAEKTELMSKKEAAGYTAGGLGLAGAAGAAYRYRDAISAGMTAGQHGGMKHGWETGKRALVRDVGRDYAAVKEAGKSAYGAGREAAKTGWANTKTAGKWAGSYAKNAGTSVAAGAKSAYGAGRDFARAFAKKLIFRGKA